MVSLMVILFSTKRFLFVYMYIDLLKLKAYKLFENNDSDLSWSLFREVNLYFTPTCLRLAANIQRFKDTKNS